MPQSRAPQPPPLARAGIDRAAAERDTPDLVDRLRQQADTRVVAVHGDRGANAYLTVRDDVALVPCDDLATGQDQDHPPETAKRRGVA